jgi:hypothetical protein
MDYPDVQFHRSVVEQDIAPRGKLDLDKLGEHDATVLLAIQRSFNEALASANRDISGHVPHDSPYFDYVDSEEVNAYAFRGPGYSFIGATVGLIHRLSEISERISKSPRLLAACGLSLDQDGTSALFNAIFRLQLQFLIAHEYTHHVHGTVGGGIYREYPVTSIPSSNLLRQAAELDADGYATYFVLEHLIISDERLHLVRELGAESSPTGVQDRRLFSCFLAAVAGFFVSESPQPIDETTVYEFSHPPRAARMGSFMSSAMAWCKERRPALFAWMELHRFQEIMRDVNDAVNKSDPSFDWKTQNDFLESEAGKVYRARLDSEFRDLILRLHRKAE